jgi:hypothetical protein
MSGSDSNSQREAHRSDLYQPYLDGVIAHIDPRANPAGAVLLEPVRPSPRVAVLLDIPLGQLFAPPPGRPRSDDRTGGLRAQALVAGVGDQSDALVFGCGYERLGDGCCSATTLRRRRDEWIAAGVFDALRRSVLAAYQRLIGPDLTDVSVDECITKAPGGGSAPVAARSIAARAG